MAKILKFCSSCNEGFAEKFAFCPNCGAGLTAYEMNPVADVAEPRTPSQESGAEAAAGTLFVEPFEEAVQVPEPGPAEEIVEEAEPAFEESSPVETETVVSPSERTSRFSEPVREPVGESKKVAVIAAGSTADDDDGFHLTFVEEKNGKQKAKLLLGALALVLSFSVGLFTYALFKLSLEVEAIDAQMEAAFLAEIEAAQIDAEDDPRDSDKAGGGGGGGGKEQDKDASDGRLASQSKNPVNPPTPMPQLTNPELPQIMETQGNNQRPITDQPLGIPGALSSDPSSGRGSGGGIGGGYGSGQGGGRGTGEGNGIGSGSGNGNGDGDGDGDGDGPPRLRTGPTVGVKILSKPRAQYTDSARRDGIQGKVVLKVTFQADGRIGSIVPVSGLSGGLTERAIAAARGISFEPAMKSGMPYSVTKTIEYSFTIY